MHVAAAPSCRTPLALLALLAVTSLGITTGCAFLRRLSGTNTVDLEGADVKSVGADIRKQQKTICPREEVQMGVFMEVTLKGEKQVKSFETWEGHGEASKNDRIEFSEFAFHSEMGSFDEAGWFRPNPDMKASADKEFVLQTVYKRRPDKFSLETRYKPDYSCVKRAGKPGAPGSPGSSGSSGKDGSPGQSGGQTSPGGDGGDGSDGGSGSGGGDGGDGLKIQAFATMVKTPFYDKLVAIRLTGDLDDLLLAPPDQPLVLSASGGPGGRGGNGGNGGRGGGGGSGSLGGKGGKGGKGGDGASGGKGGKGGEIELIFDERFPDLGSLIKLDVAGGDGGSPGGSGSPGSGGSAGPGSGQNGKMGSSGSDGSRGRDGGAGPAGPAGRAAARAGSVGDRFTGLGAITPLGDAQPAAPPPKDDPKGKGKKDDPKGKKDEPKGKKK